MAYPHYEHAGQVRSLDQNTIDGNNTTVFPNGLYSGEPHHEAYICSFPRNTKSHYIINRERDSHPDHFSRFGYARSFFGYSYGHHPGRYQTSGECSMLYDPDPAGMAPDRFYKLS